MVNLSPARVSMEELLCPDCNEWVEIKNAWDQVGDDITCPHCGGLYLLEFDESWDPETGEEWGYFFLTSEMRL